MSWWDYQNHTPPQASDHEAKETGLLHPTGRKIMREPLAPGFRSPMKPTYTLGETPATEGKK